jgi:hypothetical protein
MSTVEFFPERLNVLLAQAYETSMAEAAALAEASAPAKEAGAELVGSTLKATGIGPIFEEGAKPHTETGSSGFLYLKGLDLYVSSPVHHPGMAPRPYIGPTAVAWATEIFQRTARSLLAVGGFR